MNWTNGLAAVPPLWEMSTESEILAEQRKEMAARLEEKRKSEEARRMEVMRKQKEEEDRKEESRREEERRLLEEEETLRVVLGLVPRINQGQQELKEAAASLVQLQREREKEEKEKEATKKRLEEQRRKQEEMKRLEEAQKKKEDKERRKEEEKERKRLAEDEKKRQEEERKRAEKEAEDEKRRQEELAAAQLEQQRRQEEALRCLKQQQMKSRIKPWSQSPQASASLIEIQAQEKEKKLQEQQQRDQLVMLARYHEQQIENELQTSNGKSNGLSLKWADSSTVRSASVKSFEEIQREEQLHLSKQMEKDRQERAQQQREMPVTAGIWSGSSVLSWTNHNNSSGPWGGVTATTPNPASGFWDDTPALPKPKAKTPTSPVKGKTPVVAPQAKKPVTPNSKPAKPKSKREEAAVMKLFEPQEDEFTTWCLTALDAFQTEIEAGTFCSFLRDIDSPYEVKDYVKTYLGENKESGEFARQFLERRSRWRAAQKTNIQEDDMCAPAAAINPVGVQNEAQDPNKKGKKLKKGKMLKVDSRILGFSVTAAQNRINVGERETWDPNS